MEKNVYSRKSRKKHTVHKVCAWVLAAIMLFSALPAGSMIVHAEDTEPVTYWTDEGIAATAFEGGDGTEGNPYIIKTPEQLAILSGATTSNHYKVADGVTELDMSAHEWVPIKAFYGTFDGNGVTIKGLGINNSAAEERVGFIFNLGKSDAGLAVIKNLNFADVSITVTRANTLYVGVIAGRAYSATIDNCKVLSGSVTATGTKTYVGGLVGIAETPSTASAKDTLNIYNCYNNSNINATSTSGSTGVRAGGIAGYIYKQNAAIINTANAGDITVTNASTHTSAKAIAGGLLSTLSNGVSGVTDIVSNCYNAGTVSAAQTSQNNTLDDIVGAVGTKTGSTASLENCYYAEGSSVSSTYGEAKAIQSEDFVTTLNRNVENLSDDYTGLLNWKLDASNYPVPYVETTQGGGDEPEQEPTYVAQIGDEDKQYATLEEAIEKAVAGDNITLLDDIVSKEDLMIGNNITLDLNGKTLTASSAATFGGNVVDSSENKTGLLKVDSTKCAFSPTNSQMPVYNGEGYVFRTITPQETEPTVTEGVFKLIFKPLFGETINGLLADSSVDTKISFRIRLDWKEKGTPVTPVYLEYTDEMVQQVYGNGMAFSIKASGVNNYEGLTITPLIVSDQGAEWTNVSFSNFE